MVFLARPLVSGSPELPPTFRPPARPIPAILANFSAELPGLSTADLENLKLRVVLSEKTLRFLGESLEVARKYRSAIVHYTEHICNIIFIIVTKLAKKETTPNWAALVKISDVSQL
jgi:hypothetical protein